MIMGKILILHAWYENPKSQWYPWLKKELVNKGYEAEIPDLPTMNSDLPDLDKLLGYLERRIDKGTIIIGHSLGGVLALRLGEKIRFKKLISVAGWDYDDLYAQHRLFWKNKIEHDSIIKNVGETVVIHSDNDPYLTALQAENMSQRLKGKFILVKDAGHFTNKDGITKIKEIIGLF